MRRAAQNRPPTQHPNPRQPGHKTNPSRRIRKPPAQSSEVGLLTSNQETSAHPSPNARDPLYTC